MFGFRSVHSQVSIMAEKVITMMLKVDLKCSCCCKKIKKVLRKFPQIKTQVYDEKANTVTITVVCCNPEKFRDKLCCKGGKTIISIGIKPTSKPVKPPEKPKTPTCLPVLPCLPVYPVGVGCGPCNEGNCGVGPCYRGCGRPVPCYDVYGYGYIYCRNMGCYVRQCNCCEENLSGCTIM